MTIKTGTFEIINERGLHARASAKFVKLAQTFDSETHVSCNGETVGGTSIMGL
ncbi:MAG: HPr family phosphocarrier protein, partial [Pseudomonadota bacterium]